ncbi:neutral amino acid transporter [Cryptococcus neoformans C23]|uniref:Neutral amino acid transporter n=2 Tax=Cryptococcus neoformans TaxID=5207 RepID=A0A854QAK0_CRYNE|nr:neutral amino acid transporter [Cryptococcus neoformans var. grubii H99]AUB25869.1 neutral amino acid transporter [Cryptococcus neoformans var. grubii]OWZ30419.1 neutral amino acid transporter [Cryptococcus neoformans var. grubii AD2-60a]OWZ39304.1 neutral amino acid transporter [Cryptococcus neoformans var. grubii AD1-83a]OWZ42192.1 neutral amino acid transporter [Cryptococcus neoformans var. grubii C23]OWZ53175.1 neutral amino acid transporter [Cryptococcus neoformans var. grubii 125.91]|eukprot:XP_012050334.1 neutral amino acid transporter [Cryptococcus neoformans var. grubii H99]
MGVDIEMYGKDSTSTAIVEPTTFPVLDTKLGDDIPDFNDPERDAVFGEHKEGQVNYRSVGMLKSVVLMIKLTIALGVLAMPQVLLDVGAVPGVIIIIAVALLTTWSGLVIGQFKRNHPEVYSMDGVGYVLAGKWGREFFSFVYPLFMVFLCGSGYITLSIAFNAITGHATCTVVWAVIGMVVTFAFASLQTLGKVSILGWIGFCSVMSAILIITIAVGVEDRPEAAPSTGPWEKDVHAFRSDGTFLNGMSAVSTVVFAYCGTPAFFNVIGEMREPKRFNHALYSAQSVCSAVYLTIGIVVYYYCGQYLSNPALGSAGLLIKKIAYGVALPGLFVGCILYTHVGAKMVFVRLLRGSAHLTAPSFTHWAVWLGTVGTCVFIAFILAESIPFFGDFVSLIGATLGTFLCFITEGWMWLHDNWGHRKTDKSLRFKSLVALNVFLIVLGIFIVITGTWASVVSINDSYKNGAITSPFSCADNSG